MDTTKKRMCCSIILIIILVSIFKITVFALKKDKDTMFNTEILNIETIDSMVYTCKSSKEIYESNDIGISLSAPKYYVQENNEEDLYISSDSVEILSIRFNDKEEALEYYDDKYAYLYDDAISVKSNNEVNFNIDKTTTKVVQYNFKYEKYTYYTYFIISVYENDYILTFVGTQDDIKNHTNEIKSIIESMEIK